MVVVGTAAMFYILYNEIEAARGRSRRDLEEEQWWYILHVEEILLTGTIKTGTWLSMRYKQHDCAFVAHSSSKL